jgi:phosphatidate cytidylyltransferase
MLKQRVIAGSFMAGGILAILLADHYLATLLRVPFYPFLFLFTMTACVLATRELVSLIPEPNRPPFRVCALASLAILGVHFLQAFLSTFPGYENINPRTWTLPAYIFGGFILVAFLFEMYRYRASGHSITKIAHSLFVVSYIAILPSFFVKLRWLHTKAEEANTTGLMLTLTIFVPKIGDVSAYFFGRAFGRNKITPLLSPKKTWEGFIGSFVGSMLVSLWVSTWGPVFKYGWIESLLFGIAIGFAGVLGDLAESLIKRDGNMKDASQTVPGFGGLLDVFDSVIFAGPVAYLWFITTHGLL